MKRKITWLNFADELAECPGLLDGMGFVVTSLHESNISVDVYGFSIGGAPDIFKVGSAYVKWDGCSTLDVDGLHLCGFRHWHDEFDLIRRGAFTLAAQHMKRFSVEESGWKDDRPLVEVPAHVREGVLPDEIDDGSTSEPERS